MKVLEALIRWRINTGWKLVDNEPYGEWERAIIDRMGPFEFDFGQGSEVRPGFKTEFLETQVERETKGEMECSVYTILTRCSIEVPYHLTNLPNQRIYEALMDDFDIVRWNPDIGAPLPIEEVMMIDERFVEMSQYDGTQPPYPTQGVMTTPMSRG